MKNLLAEDNRMMRHCYRSFRFLSANEKERKRFEKAAEQFRIEGRLENVQKNRRTSRKNQSKRGKVW